MRKLLITGTVVSVLVVITTVLTICSPVDEFDPVRILEEQGYTNIEVVDKKIFGASYYGEGPGIINNSTMTMVHIVKATSPDGKDVEAEVHCCYPFNHDPTIKINHHET